MTVLTHKVTHVAGERSVVWLLVNHRSRWHRGYTPHLLLQQLMTLIYLFPRQFSCGEIEWRHQAIDSADERFACYWIVGRDLASKVSGALSRLGAGTSTAKVLYGHVQPPLVANGCKPIKRVRDARPPAPSKVDFTSQFHTAMWYADLLVLHEGRERLRSKNKTKARTWGSYLPHPTWDALEAKATEFRRLFGVDLQVYFFK